MIPYDVPQWIVLVFLFALGSVLGSFLNVCIYRIPHHASLPEQLRGLWSPPSFCPRCHNRISRWDNVPIVGWLKVGGRCRFCRGRIPIRYPLIELFNALLFVIVYWCEVPADWGATIADSCVYAAPPFGPQGIPGTWMTPVAVVNWRYAYHMVLLEALVVATFIDLDHMVIPDAATVPAMMIGLLGGAALGQVYLVPVWFQDPGTVRTLQYVTPDWLFGWIDTSGWVPPWIARYPHGHGLLVGLVGLAVGGGMIWMVRLIGQWALHREAMGFGDVVLTAMIGSFLGWQPTVIVFFLAPACALIVVALTWLFRRRREIPYGPYLSAATLIVLLGWRQIWPVAQRIFALGPLIPAMGLIMAVMLALTLLVMQGVKRLLGIPLYPEPGWIEQWTSADQLAYFAGQTPDLSQGQWRTKPWPGESSGRGTVFYERWRYGPPNAGQQSWSRRS